MSENTTIAVDMDNTLAAVSLPVMDSLGDDEHYTYANIESWEWPIEMFGEAFLDEIYEFWRSDWQSVPPMEPGLATAMQKLSEECEVHIVTHQPEDSQVRHGKCEWLRQHDIPFDVLRTVNGDTSKAELADEYDAFIDDKPALPERVASSCNDAAVYLRDQPYNRRADGEYTRTRTVAEAVEIILVDARAQTLADVNVASDVLGATMMMHMPERAFFAEKFDDKEDENRQLPSGDEMSAMVAEDVATLLTDSRDTHGDAVESHQHVAQGWTWYLRGTGVLGEDEQLTGSDVGRMMPIVKMSRAAVGTEDVDHDRDIAGYGAISAACQVARGEAELEELQEHVSGDEATSSGSSATSERRTDEVADSHSESADRTVKPRGSQEGEGEYA